MKLRKRLVHLLKKSTILSNSLKSLLIKLFSMVLTLFVSVILARKLTVEGYGYYTYAFSLISILIIPISLGLPNMIVKYVSEYSIKKEYSLMKGLIRTAFKFIVISSLVVFALAYFSINIFEGRVMGFDLDTFSSALLLLPILSINTVVSAIIRGQGKVLLGQLSHSLLYPLFFCVVLLIYGQFLDYVISPSTAMLIHIVSIGIAVVINLLFLDNVVPQVIKKSISKYQYKEWARTALPFFITSGMLVISSKVDTIMLGIMMNQENVAIYSIASKGASVLGFAIQSVNSVVAPTYSKLYTQNNIREIQKNYSFSSMIIFFITLPLAIFIMIFSKEIIGFIYGQKYISSALILSIMCIGQAINAFSGTNGTLLNMTGHERISAYGVLISTIANIVMNLIMIPIMGMKGAAIASVISFIIWNLILSITIYKRLNVVPLPFIIRRRE